ncbi:MAG: class I SAM-dependent methyltransferase [Candidatus Aminicenantes bacterium]|nr:class I SAM-dependent methyltransferase [Candidatus Aminicenantes bacterium]
MLRNKPAFLLLFALVFLQSFAACQIGLEEPGEWSTNRRQPPDKVMAAVGVEPGMVIGEVGAGRGRFTVLLAAKVGPTGKIYAEDIDRGSLDHLRERCAKSGLKNVEVIAGEVSDPLFPKASLDMVFMVLTYHHLSEPVALLKNLIPSLKPGATVIVIDPDPEKDRGNPSSEYTSKEKMEREAGEAGFELVRIETFLEKDSIFILRPKGTLDLEGTDTEALDHR